MAKDGNINDSSSIQSGRKGEDTKKYASNYDRIFGSNKTKEDKKDDIPSNTNDNSTNLGGG